MRFAASLPLPAEACSKLIQLSDDPTLVYSWLEQGDPLELEPRVAAAVRNEAVLVDAERVLAELKIHLAKDARTFTPETDLNTWIDRGSRVLCWRLLEKDAVLFARDKEYEPPGAEELSLLLALPTEQLMRRLTDFHRQEFETRQAFFELLINGKSPLQCLGEGLGPTWLLRDRCLYAMKALYLTDDEKAAGMEGWRG